MTKSLEDHDFEFNWLCRRIQRNAGESSNSRWIRVHTAMIEWIDAQSAEVQCELAKNRDWHENEIMFEVKGIMRLNQ